MSSTSLGTLPNFYDPRSYGAAADGVTADNVPFQDAIDAAAARYEATGMVQTVRPSPGTYYLPASQSYRPYVGLGVGRFSALTWRSGVNLVANRDVTLYCPHGPGGAANGYLTGDLETIIFADNLTNPAAGGAVAAGEPTSNWGLYGVIFKSDATTGEAEINSEMVTVTGASTDIEIVDCVFEDNRGDMILVIGDGVSEAQRLRFAGNLVQHLSGQAINISCGSGGTAKDIEIAGNTFVNCHTIAECLALGGSGGVERCRVVGNISREWGTALHFSYGSKDCVATGNLFYGKGGSQGSVVSLQSGSNISITGNLIDSSMNTVASGAGDGSPGLAAREQQVTDLVIADNTFKRGRSEAILLVSFGSSHTRVTISGNTIISSDTGADANAIALRNTTKASVVGNVSEGTAPSPRNGFDAYGASTRVTFHGNRIYDGKIVCDATNSAVTGNEVINTTASDYAVLVASDCKVNDNQLVAAPGSFPVVSMSSDASRVTVNDNSLTNMSTGSVTMVQSNGNGSQVYVFDNLTYAPNASGLAGTDGDGIQLGGTSAATHRKSAPANKTSGSASKADNGTIAHGLPVAPTKIQIRTTAAKRMWSATADATNITLRLHDDTGTAVAVAETVYWTAEV